VFISLIIFFIGEVMFSFPHDSKIEPTGDKL